MTIQAFGAASDLMAAGQGLPDAPLAMPDQDLAPAGPRLRVPLLARLGLISWPAPGRAGTDGIGH